MALNVPAGISTDQEALAKYNEAIDAQLKALENRGGTNWFQIAGALANPGRTGSAGEAFGRAMDVVGKQREEQEAQALPIAQMRAQLAGQKYELAQQGNAMNMLKGMYSSDEKSAPVAAPRTTVAASSGSPINVPYTLTDAKVAADVNNPSGIKPHNKFAGFETPEQGVQATQQLVNTYLNTPGWNTPEGLVRTWTGNPTGTTPAFANYLSGVNKELDTAGIKLDKDGKIPNTPEANAAVTRAIITHESGFERAQPFLPFVGTNFNKNSATSAQSPVVAQISQVATQSGMWKPDPQLLSMMLAGNKNDARSVLNEISKVNIEMQKPTDLQRDLKALQSGGSPIMTAGILAKYFGDAVKPFDVMTKDGTVQSTILQQLAPMMGQVVGGQRPDISSLQTSTMPPTSGAAPASQGQITVSSLNNADRIDTGLTPGSKEDLAERAKIIGTRLSEKDKEWLPQRAAVQTWNPIEVQNYENDLKLIDSVAKSKPHVFGQLQSQGALTAIGQLAQSGVNTPWGSVNMDVDKFLRTLNLDPKDKAIADDVGHAMARIFFANAKAYKSVLGPQISNSDATLMRSPMVTLEDQSNVIRHWVGQQILNNEQRLDLYKALNSHDNKNPHASLGHFFTSEDSPIFQIAKKYGAAQDQWRKISPLYNQ